MVNSLKHSLLIAFYSILFLGSLQESLAQIYTDGNGVVDLDGNFYPSIILGTQEWMKINLRTTYYSNGNRIEHTHSDQEWIEASLGGAVSSYDDNPNFDDLFGKLYNWFAIDSGVCPIGWHVPTREEFQTLKDYLGGTLDVGGMMKREGTETWLFPNEGATNLSGFNAVGSGQRIVSSAGSRYMTRTAEFWTSTENNQFAYMYKLSYADDLLVEWSSSPEVGRSCRCVKDGSVAVDELERDNLITIGPNPTQGSIKYITTRSGQLLISNNIGQTVKNIAFSGTQTVDLSNFETGIYFFNFITPETTTKFKVMKY